MDRVSGKIALVSGAASGIRRCDAVCQHGAKVMLIDSTMIWVKASLPKSLAR